MNQSEKFFTESNQRIIEKFAKNQLLVLIGFEFEFFLVLKDNLGFEKYPPEDFEFDENQFLENARKILLKNHFNGKIEKETDKFQFEIISAPTPDPYFCFLKMQDALKQINEMARNSFRNLEICHKAKPFEEKPGNGLHFHLSVHKIPNMENIFKENHDFCEFLQNEFMSKIIGVCLVRLKKQIKNFFQTQSMISRIKNFDRNTPSVFAWGKNNRSTPLRIPESPLQLKRIELRFFSSEHNFSESLNFFLKSCEIAFFEFENFLESNSLNQKNFLPKPVFGLAFDQQYNLDKFIDLI